MSTLDKQTATSLERSLNKDFTFAPQSSSSFVLNGIRDSHTGGKTQYQSEPGNEKIYEFAEGVVMCGWIYGQGNEIYLLSKHPEHSEIGIFKENQYQPIVTADLGFDPKYPITGEYRVKNGCERIIYWGDGNSPDYFYNFERDELFRNDMGVYDPNLFKVSADILPPKIDLVAVNNGGGNLPLGSYYFQIEVLDESLNSLYKTDLTPQTPIIDDDYSNTYNLIDGGLNIPQYTEQVGGLPPTNKSITLRFYNLNTTFAYIRVNVIRQLAGIQTIDAHAVGTLIPIGSEDFKWTYTGYNLANGDYPLDFSETLVDNIKYETSYVQEQVQGRFVRANLKQAHRDYTQYQAVASQMEVHWVASEVKAEDHTDIGNAKNPHTYWLKTTAQGDEIVALGVRFLHKDGWSPVFHIPGKPPTNDDLELLTVIDDTATPSALLVWESEVKHLDPTDFDFWNDMYQGSQIRRWKVYNTAEYTESNTVAHPYSYEGTMGYYETNTTYPDIVDCDGNSIWGEDHTTTQITPLTKIRHHRLPDRRLVRHWTGYSDATGEYIMPIGFKFLNVTYPSNDVIGHQFCIVDRDEFSKTVVDSGWFAKTKDDTILNFTYDAADQDIYGIEAGVMSTTSFEAGDSGQLTGQYGMYLSANVLFNRKIFSPEYLKFNTVYDHKITGGLWDPNALLPVGATVPRTGGGNIGVTVYHIGKDTDPQVPFRSNFKIDNQVFVGENGFVSASAYDVNVYNYDALSPINIVKTDKELENFNDTLGSGWWIGYTYKKNNVKPYESLFTLNYKYLHFNYATSFESDDNVFYGGDSIISSSSPSRMTAANPDAGVFLYGVQSHKTFYEEHQLNAELRHAGSDPQNKYYKQDGNYFWLLSKIAEFQDDGTWDPYYKADISSEFYKYNADYDKQYQQQFKGVLPLNFNYCSECLNEYRNRIIFSPKSFDEESFDMFRINKVNDYIDIPAHRGPITGLKYKNNILLVHCKEGSFMLQPNPQAISTNFSDIYLSTGDFLSIPPSEIMQTDVGYAGCDNKQHQCDTPHGWCWVDELRGQIFKFDGKITDISRNGMSQWFTQNLSSAFKKAFYEVYQEDYGIGSTLSITNGVGIILYYDPRFNRLMVSKKDFLPINFQSRSVNIDEIAYDFENEYFIATNANGQQVIVDIRDADFFENRSWTLSYSFDYENSEVNPWTSWHSYIPPFAFWDNYHYYTLAFPAEGFSLNTIYKHLHKNNYQTYYENKYDFIVEWYDFNFTTQDRNAIHYNGYSLTWDEDHLTWKQNNDLTFYKGMFYTFDQSSGLVNLNYVNQHSNPYGNVQFSNSTKSVIRTDNNFKISGIYDIATNSPVVSGQWDLIKDEYFIDVVPLNANLNYNASQYQLANFRDKFLICRLYYKPEQDYKKVINILQNNNSISIR